MVKIGQIEEKGKSVYIFPDLLTLEVFDESFKFYFLTKM
jgi:hypothetical protein